MNKWEPTDLVLDIQATRFKYHLRKAHKKMDELGYPPAFKKESWEEWKERYENGNLSSM